MKNIVHIISHVSSSNVMEWMMENLSRNYSCTFIFLNPSETPLERVLRNSGNIDVYRVKYQNKKDYLVAFYKVYKILRSVTADLVHCHLYDACLIGLPASLLAGINKRIYTRHYSTLHHEYYPKGVYFDKLFNYMATDIIAISENVRDVLINKEKAKASKIKLIPHGFKLDLFRNKMAFESLQEKYNKEQKSPVIGVVSRLVHLKGVDYVIKSFLMLYKDYPSAKLLVFNAVGPEKEKIMAMLTPLPLSSYQLVDFEEQIFDAYHLFDVFVHVPVNREVEAFGQTYVEALAAGIPSVFTLSGIASDFIRHEENALVVDYCNAEQIYNGIINILNTPDIKENLRTNGIKSVERFSFEKTMEDLKELYQ